MTPKGMTTIVTTDGGCLIGCGRGHKTTNDTGYIFTGRP